MHTRQHSAIRNEVSFAPEENHRNISWFGLEGIFKDHLGQPHVT